MAAIDKLRINGTTYDVQDSKSLHYTEAQTLTDAQKTQARSNAGAASAADVTSMGTRVTVLETSSSVLASKVVRHDAQTLTDAQKTQARANIDAADNATAKEPYGALFPDTFWKKLTLINADVNNNDANNGALRPDRLYHIATESVLHFDHALTVSTTDATLQVADRIYAADGTFISTNNWKRTLTIPAGAYFRLVFRAQPDDQSVTLDITTSMAKVTFEIASELDAKVAISQGAANAGKALIVGDDGNVTLGEAGIADEVKTALLNLLQHVAYTDDQGQRYYDELVNALYGLASISVVYTQSGAVDITDSLDDLKADLVVTATMADSRQTTVPANDYTLEGTLEKGVSTITVVYKTKTATFDVVVTDARIAYELTPETVCNADKVFSTGVSVPATNEDFTIVIKAKLDKNTAGDTARFVLGWGALNYETRTAIRLGVDYLSDGYCHFIVNYPTSYSYAENNVSASEDHEVIYVIRNNNRTATRRFYCDGAKLLDSSINISSPSKSRGGNIAVCGTGTNAPTFRGTVHLLRIYNVALTDSEIGELLA